MHRGADGQCLQGWRQAAVRGQEFRLPRRTAQELHTPRLQVIDTALDFQATWTDMANVKTNRNTSEQINKSGVAGVAITHQSLFCSGKKIEIIEQFQKWRPSAKKSANVLCQVRGYHSSPALSKAR